MSRSDFDTVGVPLIIDTVVISTNDAIFTCPSAKLWRLLAASGTYSSVATGADRAIQMNITPDGNETVGVESAVNQPPSLQRGWFFSPDVPSSIAFTNLGFANVRSPSLLLTPGGEVILSSEFSVAGDQWVDPILHVIEYDFSEPIPSGG